MIKELEQLRDSQYQWSPGAFVFSCTFSYDEERAQILYVKDKYVMLLLEDDVTLVVSPDDIKDIRMEGTDD